MKTFFEKFKSVFFVVIGSILTALAFILFLFFKNGVSFRSDIDKKIEKLKKQWSKDNEKINDLDYNDTNDNGTIKSGKVSRKNK